MAPTIQFTPFYQMMFTPLSEQGKFSKSVPSTESVNSRAKKEFKRETESESALKRLSRKKMEGKSGNGTSQRTTAPGKFPASDDHQSTSVNVSDRKFSDEKRRLCSSSECKTFLGEANRNRKFSKGQHIENSKPPNPETTDKYLQDAYNHAFQRHVDNLTNVISQHRNPTSTEKNKTEVHIHPTESSKNSRNNAPKPLSKLEIKTDAGLNQKITFGDEEEDEEEFEECKMNQNSKKFRVITGNLEEENFFEELIEPQPMITFNHVCTEAEPDQISFNQIRLSSRSASPMLEVPNSKSCGKMTTRPPL